MSALKLEFYGYETIMNNVNNYIISIKNVLRGNPFMKKLAECLLVNWSEIFSSWCAEMTEGLESLPPTISTWDLFFQTLKDKAKESDKSFKNGDVLVNTKSDKPTKLKAVVAGTMNVKSPDAVAAVAPNPKTRFPKEGFECVGCGKKYTALDPNPDKMKHQAHGWPATADGSIVLCDDVKFKDKLNAYAAQRTLVVSQRKA